MPAKQEISDSAPCATSYRRQAGSLEARASFDSLYGEVQVLQSTYFRLLGSSHLLAHFSGHKGKDMLEPQTWAAWVILYCHLFSFPEQHSRRESLRQQSLRLACPNVPLWFKRSKHNCDARSERRGQRLYLLLPELLFFV